MHVFVWARQLLSYCFNANTSDRALCVCLFECVFVCMWAYSICQTLNRHLDNFSKWTTHKLKFHFKHEMQYFMIDKASIAQLYQAILWLLSFEIVSNFTSSLILFSLAFISRHITSILLFTKRISDVINLLSHLTHRLRCCFNVKLHFRCSEMQRNDSNCISVEIFTERKLLHVIF